MKPDNLGGNNDRREFLKTSLAAVAIPFSFNVDAISNFMPMENPASQSAQLIEKSIIGDYGSWAASLLKPVPPLSFRDPKWTDLNAWKKEARAKAEELIASPPKSPLPQVTIDKKYVYDGLEIEEISWQLPYGHKTEAVVLKPQGATKPLPAILGLHDHAGKKYFGYRKIVKTSENQHPLLAEHRAKDYGGLAWANEVAKRGYVVLVHDAFTFGSRRVRFEDVEGLTWGEVSTTGKSDQEPEKSENIEAYNEWSSAHEHVMSKSLFSAGTTWPGVFLAEDQIALDILEQREDVDKERMGCGGLSGGGLRTVYLGGMDSRIKCAVCVGFMTTWTDLILNKAVNHTWMTYTPILPKYLDFPEILGLRVPLPTLVQNNNQDELYTLPEMKKADQVLAAVYKKAGADDKFLAKYYDGPHKFDVQMQQDAFGWFDQWLK
ncbi:hypothetical protein [Dyadobacter sp. CY326]|uniref:hypothetical protein n=1 Tax=Dyadobacter sp. CY326 TaxID=2907300 RepID=UPI001F2C98CA|nr:hypothetical protein [Dyadobacter sp. CY326]MCE7068170.1 hypothetical protein [Dyadobacter sp. CY326]